MATIAILALQSSGVANEVHLKTNLGHDLDDAFVIAFVLAHEKLELKSIETTGDDAFGSARIAARLLWLAGREEIPVFSGSPRAAGPPDPSGMFQFGLRPTRKGPSGAASLRGGQIDLSGNLDGEVVSEEFLSKVFATESPLAQILRSLYELSGRQRPSFGYVRDVAETFQLKISEDDFIELIRNWKKHNDVPDRVLEPVLNASSLIETDFFPARVHAAENYETDIERRWWLSGRAFEEENGKRACRGMLTRNFDGKMGDPTRLYRAVIFNPVPGPPVGAKTRLRFRYRIEGADWIECQIYTLSKGYHRYTTIQQLPEGEWQTAIVDMTEARRPDGSGGPLSADERIDDIQLYTDPDAELLIDDITLYEAGSDAAKPFPDEVIFTGWFDTGKQGAEWPGAFEIVKHEAPDSWKFARSKPGSKKLRVELRGPRPMAGSVDFRFRYRLENSDSLRVALVNSDERIEVQVPDFETGIWAAADLQFELPKAGEFDAIEFEFDEGGRLNVDDLLLTRDLNP